MKKEDFQRYFKSKIIDTITKNDSKIAGVAFSLMWQRSYKNDMWRGRLWVKWHDNPGNFHAGFHHSDKLNEAGVHVGLGGWGAYGGPWDNTNLYIGSWKLSVEADCHRDIAQCYRERYESEETFTKLMDQNYTHPHISFVAEY